MQAVKEVSKQTCVRRVESPARGTIDWAHTRSSLGSERPGRPAVSCSPGWIPIERVQNHTTAIDMKLTHVHTF